MYKSPLSDTHLEKENNEEKEPEILKSRNTPVLESTNSNERQVRNEPVGF